MFWEVIRSNRRKSFFLVAGMAACLISFGYVLGMAVDPAEGGPYGVLAACVIFLVLFLISYFNGDSILLGVSKALEISPDVHPQLFNIVEEMKIASGLQAMPKVYLIPDPAFNAFATGVRPEKSAVAVTAGLLGTLNRDELQGVVAHEMSHIQNRDVLYMTFAGIMLGSIQLIAEMFLRGWARSSYSARSRSRSSSGGGQAQVVLILLALVFAVLGPVLAQLFYFSLSRKREYLADASAVRLTRHPEGLASALEKISFKSTIPNTSKITSAMFIENPMKEPVLSLGSLTSTHPPIQDRILILRKMAGADFVNYQKAYADIRKKSAKIIPPSGLKDNSVPVRPADKKAAPILPAKGLTPTSHDTLDLVRASNEFAFLNCACGLKLKVPPELQKPFIRCPHCARKLVLPVALSAVVEKAIAGEKIAGPAPLPELVYERKTKGWETFACSCGKKLQLSPVFSGSRMECYHCGRTLLIHEASRPAR